jgi:hypothetical protein
MHRPTRASATEPQDPSQGAGSPSPWQRPAPEAIRRLDTLVDPDYTDLFTVAPIEANAKSPDGWARAILEEAPAPLRLLILGVWQYVLGFRLGPRPSRDYIHGWKICDRGEDYITIETTSWLMTPHLLLKAEADRIVVATLLRYERWPARWIWPPVSILHRYVGIVLMRHAKRLVR